MNSIPLREPSPTESPTVLVDAHVHAHGVFDAEQFFECAHANFRQARLGLAVPAAGTNVLLLAESAQQDFFTRMSHDVGRKGPWKINKTSENTSLVVVGKVLATLTLVAGRQIVTREGLEVLAIGTSETLPDNLPVEDVLHAVRQCGALAIVPDERSCTVMLEQLRRQLN